MQLRHEIEVVPLRQKELLLLKPEKDREDRSIRVMKAHTNELANFFGHVIFPMIHRYPLIEKLVPIHPGYEVDGILM